MITCIIFAGLVFIITLIWFIKSKIEDFGEWVLAIWASILLAGLGFGLGAAIGLLVPIKTTEVKTSSNIEALQDNGSAYGSFFLGCGSINGTMKYVFYYETPDGYRMKQLYYYDATIKYCDNNPRIEAVKTVRTKDAVNKFSTRSCAEDRYIFYIPKGSIKQNYTLDAQ